MKRKAWLTGLLCLLLTACQMIVGRLRPTPTATIVATETVQLSATDTVVASDTHTPTTTLTLQPTKTTPATSTPIPTQPTATHQPATDTPALPTPTTTREPATPETVPQILNFEANVQEADPGDTIVFTWQTTGATGVILYLIPPSHIFPQSGWDGPPTGSHPFTIPLEARNYSEFLLYAYNAANQHTSKGLTVYLRCPDPWFFSPAPDICPTKPLVSAAAEQHFENGVMLWIAEEDRIIVLYGYDQYTTKYASYQDNWNEGEPDHDPTLQPPEGLQQPIRGFGLVWRTYPEVRDRLGWASAGEFGYNTIIQLTTRYKYNETYIRAADGNVWHLGPEGSRWDKIIVQP